MSAHGRPGSAFFLSSVLCCVMLSGTSAVAESDRDWSELPDFGALRAERGARDDFADSCGLDGGAGPDDPTVPLLNEEKWEAAIDAARTRLESCPVDIAFHYYMAVALHELGREADSGVHLAWHDGLIESILESGDGRSLETAFVTISVQEEYDVLSVFGLTPKNQKLVDGRDRFEVVDEVGEEHVIYFFPKSHWDRLRKLFPE